MILLFMVRSSVKSSKAKDYYEQYRTLSGYKSTLAVLSFIFPVFVLFLYIWISIRLKRLRNKPRKCNRCGAKMKKLNEEEDNRYLTPQENTEEKLQSVDYDVWLCDQCGNTEVYPYENRYTKYSTCPQCHAKSLQLRPRSHTNRTYSVFNRNRRENISLRTLQFSEKKHLYNTDDYRRIRK